MLPTDIRDNGTFIFDIKPQPAVRVFIDPAYATGYDYAITNGNNAITSALFPVLAGDSDGYQVYALGDTTAGGLLGTVLGGEVFTFAGQGVTGFSLRGIDAAAAVDPANPTGFVTGLTFANGNAVSIAQSPVAVPEPGVWLMMALGGALRLRGGVDYGADSGANLARQRLRDIDEDAQLIDLRDLEQRRPAAGG